jgi:hypothetical protein
MVAVMLTAMAGIVAGAWSRTKMATPPSAIEPA